MRICVVFLSFLVLILFTVGCETPVETFPDGRVRVLSTVGMIDDIVAAVGGERIVHEVLITGEIDPHSYELVKGDDEKIGSADVVFANGLHLEHGASLQYKLSSHPHAVLLGDHIRSLSPDLILVEKGQLDPHIWMDISLWSLIVDPIVEALSKKDPEAGDYYAKRGQEAKNKMLAQHRELKEALAKIPPSKRYLVTSHDAFSYFARAYLATEEELKTKAWKKRVLAPEGLAPDGQLSTIALREIVDHLIANQVEVVFPESNVSRASLRKIVLACQEKNMQVRFSNDTLYGDCMGPAGSYEGTYLGMLAHNGSVLQGEWQ